MSRAYTASLACSALFHSCCPAAFRPGFRPNPVTFPAT